jgi:hypothetical protein
MKKWSQDGNPLEEEEMLAIHQLNRNQSFIQENEKMVMGRKPPTKGLAVHPSIKPKNQSFIKEKWNVDAGWKPPRRGRNASCPFINQTRKSIIRQGKRE